MDYQDFVKKADGQGKTVGGYHIIRPKILAQYVFKKKQKGKLGFVRREIAVEVCGVTDETFSCPKENAKKVEILLPGKSERFFVDAKYLRIMAMTPDIILE